MTPARAAAILKAIADMAAKQAVATERRVWCPQEPHPKQAEFLALDCEEALYGGAAGGGKSSTLLMGALQYVDVPNYSALILRRTYADLALPGAIMDRAGQWLRPTAAKWRDKDKQWVFPSGARITFGYLETEVDKYRYQGSEHQYCLASDTPILMADGSYKPVSNVHIGDMVETLEGPRPVTMSVCRGTRPVVRLRGPWGSIRATPDHAFLTDSGWACPGEPPPTGHGAGGLCGAHAPSYPGTDPDSILPPGDAAEPARSGWSPAGPGQAPSHSLGRLCSLPHPYTSRTVETDVACAVDKVGISPSGEAEVWDLTVAGASHCVTWGGFISRNCGFDELSQFSESQYLYVLSRLRRLKDMQVPIRARSASNPGGSGHDWVKQRFVDKETCGDRVFIPARLDDNPSLDREEYLKSLNRLDDLTRRQLRDGEWVRQSGGYIYPITEANLVQAMPPGAWNYILSVDLGSSLHKPTTAFTINAYGSLSPHVYAVESTQEALGSPGDIAQVMQSYARSYDLDTMVVDEGGLGIGYIREFQNRYRLPVEPAQNRNKRGYRKLIRGDIERGAYKIVEPANQNLVKEMKRLQWNEAGTDAQKGADDHATDSALYGYIHCHHYLHEKDDSPAHGSIEAIEAEAEAMLVGDDEDDDDRDTLPRLRRRRT